MAPVSIYKPEIIALTKADMLDDKQPTKIAQGPRRRRRGTKIYPISAPLDEGVEPLLDTIIERLGDAGRQAQEDARTGAALVAAMKLAITGGTGFVGPHLIDAALARRPRDQGAYPPRPAAARRRRMGHRQPRGPRGAAQARHRRRRRHPRRRRRSARPDAAGFEQGNVTGTLAMLAAATAGGIHRFVHVSSLAAREPKLSLYGGSKARAEELVERSGLDWTIVRPPAVYGPGDNETLELFRMAKLGLMLMPPSGPAFAAPCRRPCARCCSRCRARCSVQLLIEPDDGKPAAGLTANSPSALGTAVGKKPAILSSPGAAASPRRARRPVGSRPQRQADRRPRRLFLAPRLGDRTEARAARRTSGIPLSTRCEGLAANRGLVPRFRGGCDGPKKARARFHILDSASAVTWRCRLIHRRHAIHITGEAPKTHVDELAFGAALLFIVELPAVSPLYCEAAKDGTSAACRQGVRVRNPGLAAGCRPQLLVLGPHSGARPPPLTPHCVAKQRSHH